MSAVIDMYGLGLTRIVEILDEDESAARGQAAARRRRGGRQPAADPRPLSGPDRGAGHRGTRQRPSLHGVPRRQRGAGLARGRRRPAPPRGKLRRLPGLFVDPGAGDQDGARGGGTRPARHRGRGDRAGPARSGRGDRHAAACGAGRRVERLGGHARLPRDPPGGTSSTARSTALGEDQLTRIEVDGTPIVVAKVEGSLLAYLDSCPSCERIDRGRGARRGDARPARPAIAATSCRGRAALWTTSKLHLGPVPLLASETEGVRVALAR